MTGIQHLYFALATAFNIGDSWVLTCRISSKSLPASFFIADTLPPNFRMVSRPKVGT